MSSFDGYLFCDTETGGLEEHHQILEIATIRTDLNFNIKEYWRSYVCPGDDQEITEGALDTHHLTRKFLQGQPTEKEVAETFRLMCKGRGRLLFAGYNTKYDLKMLEGMKQRTHRMEWGLVMPPFCVFELAKKKLPNLPKVENKWGRMSSHTLELVCKHLGVTIHGAHRADADILATVEVARRLMAA